MCFHIRFTNVVDCTQLLYSKNPSAMLRNTGRKRNGAVLEVFAMNFFFVTVTVATSDGFNVAICTCHVEFTSTGNDVQVICKHGASTNQRVQPATLLTLFEH